MSLQTSYPDNIRAALPGQKANTEPATIISRTVEDVAGIGFGVAVAQGSGDKGVSAFGSGDTAVLGVTVRQRSLDANTPNVVPQYESAAVMTKGVIWVTCTTGCTAGDSVFVHPTTGAFQDSNANSAVQIVGARWDTSAEAAAIAQLRLG